MRLPEQRAILATSILAAIEQLQELRSALANKTSHPYGDGTYDNMVNVDSDVHPRLYEIEGTLRNAADECLAQSAD